MRIISVCASILVCAMLLSMTTFPGVMAAFTGETYIVELPTDSVEAYWKLDEASGTTANDETHNHDGDIYGSPNMNQQGKLGKSIDFDGSDDYIEVDDDAGIDFGNGVDFSIFCWVKADTNDHPILYKYGQSRGYLMYIDSHNHLHVELYLTTLTTGATGNTPIVDGEWHHVGLRRDGDTVEAWVDGGCDDYNSGASGNLANNGKLYIGSDGNGIGNNFFDGKIDDARIYRLLVSPTATMTSHWKLDEKSGSNADDDMNLHDGTVYSGLSSPNWANDGGHDGLDLDGTDDYVWVPDTNDDYDFDSDFSIFLWIKPDNVDDEPILTKMDYSTGYRMSIDSSGYLYVEVDVGANVYSATGTTDLTSFATSWYHVGMVRRAGILEAWVNGYCEDDTPGASGDTGSTSLLYIGRDSTNYIGAIFDDVRIYGEAVVPAN